MSFKNPESQVARWLERLQQYNFDFQYRPGRAHKNANALSRRPCENIICSHAENKEKKELSVNLVIIREYQHHGSLFSTILLQEAQKDDPYLKLIIERLEENVENPKWDDAIDTF